MTTRPGDTPATLSPDTATHSNHAIRRVAFVVPKLVRGGAEQIIVLLAKAFVAEGIPSLCVCLEYPGPLGDQLAQDGVPVVSLDSRKGHDLMAVFRLARLLRQFDPTVISIHDRTSLPYTVLANMLAARRPIVFSAHGLLFRDFDRPRWSHRLAAKRLAGFTAESERVAERYTQHLGWSRPVDRVPNGVSVPDLSPTARTQVRQAMGVPDDTFVFVSVGNAKPEKGFEDLLDAASLLRRQAPDRPFQCWIVGAPQETDYQAQLLAKHALLDLENQVKFLGFQPDLQSLYQAADAFLLSSRSEGLPMVLLESMMAGLPALATRVGAVPDVVTDDVGLLVDPCAPDQLSQAMARLLHDRNLCQTLGANARRRAVAEYSVQTMAARYLEVFQHAVTQRAQRTR